MEGVETIPIGSRMTIGTSFEARRYTVPILDNNKGVIIIIELNELKQIFKYRKKIGTV